MATEKNQVTTYLDDDVYENLMRLVDAEQRSISQVLAMLIARALAEKQKKGMK